MIPIPIDMLEKKPDIRALILVVEDEALVRMMLVDVLDDAGFKVMEAAHADEALIFLRPFPKSRWSSRTWKCHAGASMASSWPAECAMIDRMLVW